MWSIKDTLLLILSLAISLALGISTFVISHSDAQKAVIGATQASSTVAAFGMTLQQVSLLAPHASSTIATVYAPYVTPMLLASWEANPQMAPGKTVSSPWPDHIEIHRIMPFPFGYTVLGAIVLMTSNEVEHGGTAGTIPVLVQVIQEGNSWKISSFHEESSQQ